MIDQWLWIVVWVALGVYAGWRATVLFKNRRYGFVVVLVFLGLICVYEVVFRLWMLLTAGP